MFIRHSGCLRSLGCLLGIADWNYSSDTVEMFSVFNYVLYELLCLFKD